MLLNALISIIVALIVTFLITPFIIRRMKARGLVGKDMNKLEKPKVPEMGGIGVLFGFSSAVLISIFLYSYFNSPEKLNLIGLLAGFLTILLIGFIGIIDDLIGWRKGIRQWQHALFPIFAALPLMAVAIGQSAMRFPLIGPVELGILYSLFIIPIGITGAANAANMLAGLNGLEAGLGLINTLTVLIIALMLGKTEAAIIAAALLGALIAFLYYNWFPARIFPGDSLTLMIGAGVATTVILGNFEKIGIFLFAIYFIELAFKARHKFQSQCFGIPQKDKTLKADPRGGSLTQWVMHMGKFSEKQVTLIILGMQSIVAVGAFLTFIIK